MAEPNDIVDRLRTNSDAYSLVGASGLDRLLDDAADEIERLRGRAENERMRALARQWRMEASMLGGVDDGHDVAAGTMRLCANRLDSAAGGTQNG